MNEKNANFQTKINLLKERYQFDFVSLALTQSFEDSFVLKWKFAAGNLNHRYKRITLFSGKGIAGIVFKTGKPLLIQNINEEIYGKDLFNYPIIVSESLKSIGAIPLWKDQRVEGVLLVGFRKEKMVTSEHIESLQTEIGDNFQPFYGKERIV
ncbi:GAF domain-containing protein [Bacillus niameyensis]|uniref:GAF domain-containing protein n=1 Tax=Bacillus niameyensis TaxID=1522308 RepID=UPI00078550A2|nr:GAF domain-containing protein [Bacillus niameyensis]